MKKKTKRLIYKISIVVLIACTIFMVLVGTCFGASLTYPPDVVVAQFDKSSWYNPNVYIDGTDVDKPRYYLDDIGFESTMVGYDNVAGGSFSPTQLALGSPFYRYVPQVRLAEHIRSTLNYSGQIDFINSSLQWEDGSFPLFYYDVWYRYYYGSPYGNTLMSSFTASDLQYDSGDYAYIVLSDIVVNMSGDVDYIENSLPSFSVGYFNNDQTRDTYSTRITIQYEAITPENINGEWYYNREMKTYSLTSDIFNADIDYTLTQSLMYHYDWLFYELLQNDVHIVKNGYIYNSEYLYIKNMIVEFTASSNYSNSTPVIRSISYDNEWLTQSNYFKNTIIDYQEHIGTYETVVVEYDYGIDFSDFIQSVTSIFDIEIFAGFTLLDILTGVIGVFVLIWFLKVFAGG